jgi:hypothetical protein
MKMLQSNKQVKHSFPMPYYLEDTSFQISFKNRTICSRWAYTFFRSSAIGSTCHREYIQIRSESEIRGKLMFNTWSIEYNENERIWPKCFTRKEAQLVKMSLRILLWFKNTEKVPHQPDLFELLLQRNNIMKIEKRVSLSIDHCLHSN